MDPVIYYRSGDWTDNEELEAAKAHFHVVHQRTEIEANQLVIPRYSYLPYPKELAIDVHNIGSVLINEPHHHAYVADLGTYCHDLGTLTPKTYKEWHSLPDGSYVVKGATNSRKNQWSQRMFAKTKQDVPRVVASLLDDALIADQGIYVREYIPLVQYDIGINGLPVTNEWRCFVLNGKLLIAGYYWASEPQNCPTSDPMDLPTEARNLVNEVIKRVGHKVPFFVVDVAEKASGGWIAIELNDACMSGLSMIDPNEFYRRLRERL